MKGKQINLKEIIALLICTIIINDYLLAQTFNCNFKTPVLIIDFGNTTRPKNINLTALNNYQEINSDCPDDGYYTFASFTNGCFDNHWHSLKEDHTPNDFNGNMLLVNAAEEPGLFFVHYIAGLKPGTSYEISLWITNICISGENCTATPPVITFGIECGGKQLAKFLTPPIFPVETIKWRRFSGIFTMPENGNTILIKMENRANGGCGNDFAMDDITISECSIQKPALIESAKAVPKPQPPEQKKTVKKQDSAPLAIKTLPKTSTKPILKEVRPSIPNRKQKDTAIAIIPGKSLAPSSPSNISLPKPIVTRANPVVKQIETDETELVINLYDNGEIDGDTISIYHNNQLIVNHAGLSVTPVTVKIKVDEQHPHHELVMVAENLGSIPPNTSLMIITTKSKRYEVSISSSDQKNAKVVIDLKK